MRLVAYIDGEKKIFPLREGASVIGRAEACHIMVVAKGVSRRHAQVVVEGGEASVRDLGSSNGVYVNGKKVSSDTPIKQGDIVGLGSFKFTFEGGDESDATLVEATPISDEPERPEVETERFEPDGDGSLNFDDAAEVQNDVPSEEPGGFIEDQPPSEDDTPVDEQFAPVKYEPDAQQAVGPQLVQRDGKWFLRDPDTEREVEIVPKWEQEGAEGAEAPEGAEEVVPQARRRSPLKIVAVAMGAVITFVLLIGLFKEPPPKAQPNYPPRLYNEAVNQGIQFLTDSKYEEAKKVFESAHRNLPERGVADTLVHLTNRLVANSKAPADTDWQALERDLKELKDSIYSTARIEAFAVDLLEKADREQQYIAIVSQGIDRLKAGDSEKALDDLGDVPKDSPSYKVAEPHIAKARENLRVKYENLAKNAETIQNYPQAIKHYRLASRYAENLDAYAEELEKCRKWQTDSNMLDEGRKAFEEARHDAVKPLLADILEDSPYRKEANALIEELEAKLAEIDQSEILTRITQLYLAGKGDEALRLIEDDELDEKVDQALLAKINRVLKAMKDADAAMQVKNYDEASKKWDEVTQSEPDEENQYHQQALEKLEEFERRRPEFAKDYEGRAAAANREGKFQDARRLAKKAQEYDPEGTRGAGLLKTLTEQAKIAYGQGLVLEQKDAKKAVEFFKKAREYAEPGSFHDTDSQRRIMKLGFD